MNNLLNNYKEHIMHIFGTTNGDFSACQFMAYHVNKAVA